MTQARSEPYYRDPETAAEPSEHPLEARHARQQRRRQRLILALIALFALLALATVISILMPPGTSRQATEAPPAGTEAAAPEAGAPRHPVAVAPQELPPLAASDAALLAALAAIFGDSSLSAYVERNHLARRIVATVDNLPRRSAPPAQWPVKPAAGTLATTSLNGRLVIGEHNAFRYTPYVRLLESVDTARFVEFYRRHYPLFQQAYRELGFPEGHFNDRVVEAIDVLMATPSLEEPPRLVQPKVFLQYADRDLEQLPAGQKLMLRIGPENAKRVKAKLAEIRAAIATAPAAAR